MKRVVNLERVHVVTRPCTMCGEEWGAWIEVWDRMTATGYGMNLCERCAQRVEAAGTHVRVR